MKHNYEKIIVQYLQDVRICAATMWVRQDVTGKKLKWYESD